jgi:hypothetical protein
MLSELSFITRCEPTRDHHNQEFVYWSVSSVATGMCGTNTRNHVSLQHYSGVQLSPLGTAATNRPIDDGEIGGMIGRGN